MIPGCSNKRSNYHASSGQSEHCQANNNELRMLIYQVAGFPTEQWRRSWPQWVRGLCLWEDNRPLQVCAKLLSPRQLSINALAIHEHTVIKCGNHVAAMVLSYLNARIKCAPSILQGVEKRMCGRAMPEFYKLASGRLQLCSRTNYECSARGVGKVGSCANDLIPLAAWVFM